MGRQGDRPGVKRGRNARTVVRHAGNWHQKKGNDATSSAVSDIIEAKLGASGGPSAEQGKPPP